MFEIYLFLLAWLILFKFSINIMDLSRIRNINLIPFKGSKITNGQLDVSEIMYNIVVFIPLGIYVNIFWNDWFFGKKILIGFLLSIFFETIQFVFAIGASDITDVMTNTLGGIIGVLCYIVLRSLFKKKTVSVVNGIGLTIEVLAFGLLAILAIANM